MPKRIINCRNAQKRKRERERRERRQCIYKCTLSVDSFFHFVMAEKWEYIKFAMMLLLFLCRPNYSAVFHFLISSLFFFVYLVSMQCTLCDRSWLFNIYAVPENKLDRQTFFFVAFYEKERDVFTYPMVMIMVIGCKHVFLNHTKIIHCVQLLKIKSHLKLLWIMVKLSFRIQTQVSFLLSLFVQQLSYWWY